MLRLAVLLSALVLAWSASAQSLQVHKKEPAVGLLKEGEAVLVDDGSCPKGQIKKVVGGNAQKTQQVRRQRSCVPR